MLSRTEMREPNLVVLTESISGDASSAMRRFLLALALFCALCAADVDPCKRQPFRGRCPSVNGAPPTRSQFVLRYYLRNGECVSYPFGHCSLDDDEPKLFRYKEECEDACVRQPSTTLVPPMDELQEQQEQTYGTVPPLEEKHDEPATYEKPQTECQKQRDSSDGLIKGGFKPECNEDGSFKSLQCERDQETCFCVNAEGIEVANSRSKPGQVKPDCAKINSAGQPRTNECVGGADSGPCSSSIARWFYDESEQKCRPFQYSGCGGNGNNYGSETACTKRCVPSLGAAKCHQGAEPLKTAYGAPVNCAKTECPAGYKCSVVQQSSVCCPNVEKSLLAGNSELESPAAMCQLPKERGPCDRYELRFHYDINLKECKYFFYGGCDGNANNFERVEDCEKSCGHNGVTKTAPVPLPPRPNVRRSRQRYRRPSRCVPRSRKSRSKPQLSPQHPSNLRLNRRKPPWSLKPKRLSKKPPPPPPRLPRQQKRKSLLKLPYLIPSSRPSKPSRPRRVTTWSPARTRPLVV
ncbi:hypothetical protein L596_011346 [Steinernema carpocapsae]|uniref:BPTI/Kunitz inhibitor domain-containing protein n=1 Tax=Steinernema carpocapsae TaxID=34508 RepID=A0A4U5NUJ4_STECR|nr:hypothetical protein L596_011346 [Steinernema carpocapsae]